MIPLKDQDGNVIGEVVKVESKEGNVIATMRTHAGVEVVGKVQPPKGSVFMKDVEVKLHEAEVRVSEAHIIRGDK